MTSPNRKEKWLLAAAGAAGIAMGMLWVGVVAAGPTPGGGAGFGDHISGMSPEHPQGHGALFGDCVSGMATDDDCPHHAD